jgi:SAM-dependent methyltransferase
MSRFGPDPREFFQDVYEGVYDATPPWDVGGPQPALIELLNEYPPAGPALDVGCGSGDLAIALARGGLEVLGVDFVELAVEQARRKAAELPAGVADRLAFAVADALHPSRLGRRFGSVVDSGFLHLFDPAERDRFADDLASALAPGGRYYLLAFSVSFDVPNTPREVSDDELRARFTAEKGWRFVASRPAEFQSRMAPVPAIAACIERRQALRRSR